MISSPEELPYLIAADFRAWALDNDIYTQDAKLIDPRTIIDEYAEHMGWTQKGFTGLEMY
jgi:hypothetical protein|tara:strand:- start:2552 stop:2731 length:180 start_codon:yes stop_codon:yes gene_type:complete